MLIRQPVLWIAAAALAAAVAYSTTLPGESKDDKTVPAEPDLFPFVQALPSIVPKQPDVVPDLGIDDNQGLSPSAAQHVSEVALAANAFRIEDTVRRMRMQGASDDEVYRTRAAALTPEKAAMLARLDREEAEWQQRVAAYLAQRNVLGADAQALQALKDGLFTAEEQVRLGVYEPAVLPLTGLP